MKNHILILIQYDVWGQIQTSSVPKPIYNFINSCTFGRPLTVASQLQQVTNMDNLNESPRGAGRFMLPWKLSIFGTQLQFSVLGYNTNYLLEIMLISNM